MFKPEGGLTKRELYAAMAMQGFLANHASSIVSGAVDVGYDVACAAVASCCRNVADALLAELAKPVEDKK